MTLPEPSQIPFRRRFAIEPRHHRLLYVARAAQALEGLYDVPRRPLVQPVLCDSRRDSSEGPLSVVAWRGVEAARNPERERRRRLGLDR